MSAMSVSESSIRSKTEMRHRDKGYITATDLKNVLGLYL